MDNILELIGVSKHYRDFSIRNLNLSLERGYIMGFVGPNGAGKSTTIKLIMNLVRKDGGEIRLFGLDHVKHERAVKERIGFVYDEHPFYEELTVEEMKNVIRPFYRKWDEGRFRHYVKEFELPLNRPVKNLSKGMKMKFSLAVALSHDAELFLLDEPTSGLDPLVRAELLDILQTVIQDGDKSVLFSTHITSDLDKIADFITIIHNGEIVVSQAKDELLENFRIVKGGRELLDTVDRGRLIGVREHRYGFEALTACRRELEKQWGNAVVWEKPTLEDVMLFMIRRGEAHVASH